MTGNRTKPLMPGLRIPASSGPCVITTTCYPSFHRYKNQTHQDHILLTLAATPPPPLIPQVSLTMYRVRQMFDGASVLSNYLSAAGIPHAFYGGFLSVALGSTRDTEVRTSAESVRGASHLGSSYRKCFASSKVDFVKSGKPSKGVT